MIASSFGKDHLCSSKYHPRHLLTICRSNIRCKPHSYKIFRHRHHLCRISSIHVSREFWFIILQIIKHQMVCHFGIAEKDVLDLSFWILKMKFMLYLSSLLLISMPKCLIFHCLPINLPLLFKPKP